MKIVHQKTAYPWERVMYQSGSEEENRSLGDSYRKRHPTLVQTWIATESERRARQNDRDYDEVYEEVYQRVLAYGRNIDQLLSDRVNQEYPGGRL